ncbi:uncharacterized protein NECHADRAFT_89486 [Fusarium vanettenii 77-13-4]|uniref:FAD-binding domain-containing protein n=1 Tax=Fusarium vanettenii (strain ATCC MYA-4622 / CBS 123669 / FGSC 9596 / NRRL 45880 / 77-13-4) TaxID=660122 RepID=C7ZRB8_FUSV7|nr:uncharacterized protein NECHADRAFT_89486 [Fusarium vanettenii 77-13-4]EEU33438.1 hypothetical protein NECHADRAFT_89486 [Fusarium vanettenii 77-13-4]
MIITESSLNAKADLIVAADGLWSKYREYFLGIKELPLPTSDLAYRILLHLDEIDDPQLRDWCQTTCQKESRDRLDMVKEVDKWKLMHRSELQNWVNEESNLVFVGDSCHPMLPYLAQGANSAIEDGAVLGRLLGKIKSKDQLPGALKMYERLRKSRGDAFVKEAFRQQRDAFHMEDGPE